MEETPTGHRRSSPQMRRKQVAPSQEGLTGLASEAFAAPQESTKNPADSPSNPSPNLTGIEGLALRDASQVHSQPNIGANITIKNGFISCSVLAGVSHPGPIRWR